MCLLYRQRPAVLFRSRPFQHTNAPSYKLISQPRTTHFIRYLHTERDSELVINPYGIQYLTPSLRAKVFGADSDPSSVSKYKNRESYAENRNTQLNPEFKTRVLNTLANKSLENFGLLGKKTSRLKPVDIEDLPKLEGRNLEEHFIKIGKYLSEPYTKIINSYNNKIRLQNGFKLPNSWIIKSGWHRYDVFGNNSPQPVAFPEEDFLVFDVETLPKISPYPIIAVCKSAHYVYCWISPALEKAYHHYNDNKPFEEQALKEWKQQQLEELFPFDSSESSALEDMKRQIIELENERADHQNTIQEKTKTILERNEKLNSLKEQKKHLDSQELVEEPIPDKETYLNSINCQLDSKAERLSVYREFHKALKQKWKEQKQNLKKELKDVNQEIKRLTSDVNEDERLISKHRKMITKCNTKILKLEERKDKQVEKDKHSALKVELKSQKLDEKMKDIDINPVSLDKETLQCLIPVNPDHERKVVVGHNVSYDRARILEEYDYKDSNTFFLDTLSLHVSISGMCTKQRGRYMQWKKIKNSEVTSEKTDKDDITEDPKLEEDFEKQWLSSINEDGEEESSILEMDPWLGFTSMNSLKECAKYYCDVDVDKDIRDVFFASDSFKPIVEDIQNLINYCANDVFITDKLFQNLYPKFKDRLPHPVSFSALKPMGKAFLPVKKGKWENYVTTCESMYQNHMKDIQEKIDSIVEDLLVKYDLDENFWVDDPWLSQLDWERIPYILKKDGSLAKKNGYANKPQWYKNLSISSEKGINLTVRSQMIPIFLKLEYLGKPIVVDKVWMDSEGTVLTEKNSKVPTTSIEKDGLSENPVDENTGEEKEMFCLCFDVEDEAEIDDLVKNKNHRITGKPTASGVGSRLMVIHPNDADARTTTLISKSFKSYFENGTITSSSPVAQEALKITTMCSYWVSSRKRIHNQWVVSKDDILKSHRAMKSDKSLLLKDSTDSDSGMIIPSLLTMGTVTRRAVENTWLTASNIKANRIGSELKSLIEAPEGYCFVGADVDSEELWIGSLIADSLFENHGSTPLGWMCLEGTKKEGTDLHTTTGKILNCSRDNAKIFNYSRIYGAGKTFTAQLLKKLDPTLSKNNCKETTDELYNKTKGYTTSKPRVYYGGSESALFTKLNSIAHQSLCRTPVLKARITECLSVGKLNVQNNYLTSRINWIIQSSGVDYLHLLLISMEYLIKKYNIDARLVISIHDEVRFMCKEEDKYRTTMALQISNLWTRAVFCQALNLNDLPQSCAFFSGVDIDSVLRKEVNIDCVTVSSPEPIPPGECLDIYNVLENSKARLGKGDSNLNVESINIYAEKTKLESLSYKSNVDVSDLAMLAMVCEQDPQKVNVLKNYYNKLDREQLRNKLSEHVLNEEYEKTGCSAGDNGNSVRNRSLRFTANSL